MKSFQELIIFSVTAGICLNVTLIVDFESAEELASVCECNAELFPSRVTVLKVDTLYLMLSNNRMEIPKEH
jgi:hypothetical protein